MTRNNATHGKDDALFRSTQRPLEIFIFFSAFPAIKIYGISITFFIFIYIALKFLKHGKKIFRIKDITDILLLLFLVLVFASWIFQEDTYRDKPLYYTIKLMAQYSYWIFLALFIKTWIHKYSFFKISRSFFFASIVSSVYYITLNNIHPVFYPNSFAYAIVTTLPIGFYYAKRKFNLPVLLGLSFVFIAGILVSGSRTGTVLLIFELFLIFSLGNVRIKKIVYTLLIVFMPLFLISLQTIEKEDIRSVKYMIADLVEDYSPKIAHTLRLQESVFERDKSLLIRKLMIQKGIKMFEEHPVLGVGPGNFPFYYVSLDIYNVSHWLHGTELRYNRTSSQNSYLMILSENGIFAFLIILAIFIRITVSGFKYVISFRDDPALYLYIPFISLLFYGFILVTTMGSLFWLFLGLTLALIKKRNSVK